MDEMKTQDSMDTGDLQEVAGGFGYDPASTNKRGPVKGEPVCPKCRRSMSQLGLAYFAMEEHIKNCKK